MKNKDHGWESKGREWFGNFVIQFHEVTEEIKNKFLQDNKLTKIGTLRFATNLYEVHWNDSHLWNLPPKIMQELQNNPVVKIFEPVWHEHIGPR